MNKVSAFFLVLLGAIALLAFYQAFFPMPASITIIRFSGLVGFFLLCIATIIGPLSVFWPKAYIQLVEPRRAVGIAAFAFMLAHVLLTVIITYGFDFASIFSDISLAIAMPAFLIFLAMALTSSDWATRTLGSLNWKRLQQLVYIAFLLTFAHFLLKVQTLVVQTISGVTVYNVAQLSLIALGIITIALQLAGAYVRMKRKSSAPSGI